MIKKDSLTCPNNACGRVFDKPLKAINLQKSSKEPYNACPYCLTEVTLTKNKSIEEPAEEATTKNPLSEEKPSQDQPQLASCPHYFGYMYEKEHKKQMPDECLLCPQIMPCMAKEKQD
jgi:hypothetical protein